MHIYVCVCIYIVLGAREKENQTAATRHLKFINALGTSHQLLETISCHRIVYLSFSPYFFLLSLSRFLSLLFLLFAFWAPFLSSYSCSSYSLVLALVSGFCVPARVCGLSPLAFFIIIFLSFLLHQPFLLPCVFIRPSSFLPSPLLAFSSFRSLYTLRSFDWHYKV